MKMDSISIKNSVDNLREYAKKHDLKLVFRNHTTNAGDFCFFIYKANYQGHHTRYLIGYDGDWSAERNSDNSFESCWNSAHKFISNYKG